LSEACRAEPVTLALEDQKNQTTKSSAGHHFKKVRKNPALVCFAHTQKIIPWNFDTFDFANEHESL